MASSITLSSIALSYSVPITALLSILVIVLSLNVSRLRIKHKVSLGDGDVKSLSVAIRVHGNMLEQAIPFMILLVLLDLLIPGDSLWVLVLGTVFLGARIIYSLAMFNRWFRARQISHAVTLLVMLITTVSLFFN
ncbi:membrane-associated protein [Oleiphilus messinensis]|uniref:Membrane-associated protein n=1 Tax=Oleiphilus messinensis TaxID=141451 RepID=A0A1Y0IFQ2_9GAMM|nr:MAPEG family protein [Oleiphilus messinensis]ARU59367.1 membrane-associated protein [Oleiphilus messinensis]